MGGTLLRRPRVLVVDDEPVVGEALREALSEHDVTVVRGTRAAMEVLEEAEFDAILCDLQMPDADPARLCALVATRWPERRGQLVFMTGGDPSDEVERLLERAGAHLLAKPFDPDLVIDLIGDLIDFAEGSRDGVRR